MTKQHIIIISLLTSLFVSQFGFANSIPNSAHINVKGNASIERTPDYLSISIGIQVNGKSAEQVTNALETKTKQLSALLNRHKVGNKHISASMYSLTPWQEYEQRKYVLKGVQGETMVSVKLYDINQYPALYADIAALEISSQIRATGKLNDKQKLMHDLMASALSDAKLKAQTLAVAQGVDLGPVYSISEFNHKNNGRFNMGVVNMKENDEQVSLREPVFSVNKITVSGEVYVVYKIAH